MIGITRRIFCIGGLALGATPILADKVTGLSGMYQVDGRNPDGTRYYGTARIVDEQGRIAISWDIGGRQFTGIGQVRGNVLTVDWGDTTPVIYDISQDGVLYGRWAGGQGEDILTLIP